MNYAKLEWRDGQPFSSEFDDVYFSADHGVQETEHVFIQHNQLHQRFAENGQAQFVIAETGFGCGLNFLITAKHWLEQSEIQQCLYYYSIENTPFTPEDLRQAHQSWPELQLISEALLEQYQVASAGFHCFDLFNGRLKLVLMAGDVEAMLPQLQAPVDAWFLDGFAPGRNPKMWSEQVFSQINRLSHKGSTFSTYTSAGTVKRGLVNAGFSVQKVSGTGNKRHMLKGEFTADHTSAGHFSQPWYELNQQSVNKKSACIIGAGIAGLSSAWALVKRGYQVQIFEAGDQAGAQASGNPVGMLMPRLSLQDSADAEFYSSAYFYALRCLQQLDHQQSCWQQTGGIQLPCSERIRKQIADYPQDKALAQVLNADEASQLAGVQINETVHHFPLAACVFPRQILQQMIKAMGGALHIRYNCCIESFSFENQQWQLKNQQNESIAATDCLILASAWQTRRFAQFSHLHLQPARGQISLFRANKQSKELNLPISFGGYLLPANNQQHVCGASFELDDCDTEIREAEHQSNFDDISHWFKDLFSKSDITAGRASVRAVTPDRVPVVGPAPDYTQYLEDYADLYKGRPAHKYPVGRYLPGLYVNTGHGARGFSSAFLSSELLAATICNQALPVSKRVRYALHPARFLIRSLKKRGKIKRAQ